MPPWLWERPEQCGRLLNPSCHHRNNTSDTTPGLFVGVSEDGEIITNKTEVYCIESQGICFPTMFVRFGQASGVCRDLLSHKEKRIFKWGDYAAHKMDRWSYFERRTTQIFPSPSAIECEALFAFRSYLQYVFYKTYLLAAATDEFGQSIYNGQIYAAEPTYCSTIGGIAEMLAHVVFGLPPIESA